MQKALRASSLIPPGFAVMGTENAGSRTVMPDHAKTRLAPGVHVQVYLVTAAEADAETAILQNAVYLVERGAKATDIVVIGDRLAVPAAIAGDIGPC